MIQNLIFFNMRLYFRNFLYLFYAFICAAEFALAAGSDSGFYGLDECNIMTCYPAAVRTCYLHYDHLIKPSNLDEEIKNFKKFNLQIDPWFGFAI